MKEQSNELKRCPFCRRGARVWQHGNYTFYVQCVHCNASTDNYRTEEEAIAAWNMREEAKANTRLIAAAPEMYEMLKVWTLAYTEPMRMDARKRAVELLGCIDGKDAEHEGTD